MVRKLGLLLQILPTIICWVFSLRTVQSLAQVAQLLTLQLLAMLLSLLGLFLNLAVPYLDCLVLVCWLYVAVAANLDLEVFKSLLRFL